MEDANMTKSSIHDIVLIGQATQIPKIYQLIQEFFNGRALNTMFDPHSIVARGAAVLAAKLNSDKSEEAHNLLISDVTPLSLGIEGVDGVMKVLIKEKTTIPTKQTQILTTDYDNQSEILIHCFEGKGAITKNDNLLGKFKLSGIPLAPRGFPQIEVTYDIDANGILKITASKESKVIITEDKDRLSKKDIERMTEEAETARAENEKQTEIHAIKEGLVSYCYKMINILNEEHIKLEITEADRTGILDLCGQNLRWLRSNRYAEKNQYEERQKELYSICKPTITSLYLARKEMFEWNWRAAENNPIIELYNATKDTGSVQIGSNEGATPTAAVDNPFKRIKLTDEHAA